MATGDETIGYDAATSMRKPGLILKPGSELESRFGTGCFKVAGALDLAGEAGSCAAQENAAAQTKTKIPGLFIGQCQLFPNSPKYDLPGLATWEKATPPSNEKLRLNINHNPVEESDNVFQGSSPQAAIYHAHATNE
jgi:hypothetical protein